MSDWQVGDLALCVKSDPQNPMKMGGIYTVSAVLPETDEYWPGLLLQGLRAPYRSRSWRQSCFRKITPGHKIEGFEEPRRIPVEEKA